MDEIRIQPAVEEYIVEIAALVNGFAAENVMLPRTEESILQSLSDWVVALGGGAQLLGCGSLVSLTEQLVEIRSLAVAQAGQGKGIGRRIVEELVLMATARGYAQICALTLEEGFFEKLGFEVVDRWSISPKLWQDCIYCPKFHHCDEVAVARSLTDSPISQAQPAQTAASPLLKWQGWQPLKLAYRHSNSEVGTQRRMNRRPIQLQGKTPSEEEAQ
ncbi:MAG: GNAT family N-acetyltransferase [Caldilineaceae bacterium]|nr:GNAT family N-acetyltransferase [Caldilineaceae bacterium]